MRSWYCQPAWYWYDSKEEIVSSSGGPEQTAPDTWNDRVPLQWPAYKGKPIRRCQIRTATKKNGIPGDVLFPWAEANPWSRQEASVTHDTNAFQFRPSDRTIVSHHRVSGIFLDLIDTRCDFCIKIVRILSNSCLLKVLPWFAVGVPGPRRDHILDELLSLVYGQRFILAPSMRSGRLLIIPFLSHHMI